MAYKNKFDGGELDKWTLGAMDDPVYQRGAAWLENFNLLENGGINRRTGYKHIRDILQNTDDDAVKLIPVSADDKTNYLVYISKSKYGYIKFLGYEAVESVEKDAPEGLYADALHTVKHRLTDPDAYHEIDAVSQNIFTDAVFAEGDILEITADSEIERAAVRITGVSTAVLGKLLGTNDFYIKPQPVMAGGGTLTQARNNGAAPVDYFDEQGAGTGLKISVNVGEANAQKQCKVKVTVVDGGSGYFPLPGKDYTFIRFTIPDLDQTFVLKALVSDAGRVMSAEDTAIQGAADLAQRQRFWVRYYAPPIEDGTEITGMADYKDDHPDTGAGGRYARIIIHTEEVTPAGAGPHLSDKYYNYTFDIADPGSGWLDSFGGNDSLPESNPDRRKIFLKLRIPSGQSEVDGILCVRELRCTGHLTRFEARYEIGETDGPLETVRAALAAGGHTAEAGQTAEVKTRANALKTEKPESGHTADVQYIDSYITSLQAFLTAHPAPGQGADPLAAARTAFAAFKALWDAKTIQGDFGIESIDPVTGWYDDGMALADTSNPETAFNPAGHPAHNYSGSGVYLPSLPGGSYNICKIYEHESGLWYKKCRWYSSGREYSVYGHRSEFKWDSTRGSAYALNSIIVSMFSDTGPPVQYSNQTKTGNVYVQYGEDYSNKAKMTGVLTQVIHDGEPLLVNWTNDAAGTNDDKNYQPIAVMNDITVIPDDADVLRGRGASISVQSVYIHGGADEAPRVKFTFKVTAGGSGYFARPGVTHITAHIGWDEGSGKYRYEIPMEAGPGGEGEIQLSGSGYNPVTRETVKTVNAVLKNRVPADGASVTVTNNNQSAAQAVIAVTKQANSAEMSEAAANAYDGWECSIAVKGPPDNPASGSGFAEGGETWVSAGSAVFPGGAVSGIKAVKTYTAALIAGRHGRYKTDLKNTVCAAVLDSRSAEITVTDAVHQRESLLEDILNPEEGIIYKVEQDEVLGGIATFWMYENGGWKEKTQIQFPQTADGINALQYVYNGAFIAVAGTGCLPFILELRDGSIFLDNFQVKQNIDYDLTAPAEFEYRPLNTVPDPAVPVSFCRSLADSPSVIYYDSGRRWMACTVNEPDRIWVSKPVKNRADKVIDFSTYINFLTVSAELTPFKGIQELNTDVIRAPGDGITGRCTDALKFDTKGKDVTFGIIKPEIIGTPYFKHGARVNSAGETLALDTASVPVKGEYTKRAMADLMRGTALYTPLSRIRISIPGAGALASADGDGFELRTYPPDPGAGVAVSFAGKSQIAVPYTGWGTPAESAGIIAGAVAAAVLSAASNPALMIAAGSSAAVILTAARFAVNTILNGFFSGLSLALTDGSTDSPSLSELSGGGYAVTTGMLQTKCGYLLAKHRLYEEEQPFVLRTWKIKEDHCSAAGCGFTFRVSSGERESINLITNNRSFFISTAASERIMPSAVNGEVQQSSTGSFFGSEKLQPAKAADAVYFLQKGGQRIMRAYWAPSVPVPVIEDLQKYSREILRGRKIIPLKSARTLPVKVWCVPGDGTAAVITDAAGGGRAVWSRVTSGAGKIIGSAAMSISGVDALRAAVLRDAEGTVRVCAIPESMGEPGDVFLDAWRVYSSSALLVLCGEGAVIWDRETGETRPLTDPPVPGPDKYTGYPYTGRMRTLPLAASRGLKPVRIACARFRFLESALPFIRGYPSGAVNRITAHNPGRYLDGVPDIPVPGNAELDAAFEVFTEEPEPLSVICYMTEEEV